MITVYVPENLDLDKILSDYPPGEAIDKDKLLLLLGQITDFALFLPKDEPWDGWSHLMSTRLQSLVHDYNRYMKYAKETEIINLYDSYIAKVRSKGYRFTDKYQTPWVPVEIEGKEPRTHTKEGKVLIEESIKLHKRKYLTKWLDSRYLNIDYEAALKFITSQYDSAPKKVRGRVNLKAINRYNSYLISIDKIHKGNLYMSIDDTSSRLHSNLTGLKSELRKFLTFQGKSLISLDLKNSQPYLSIALLNKQFYLKNTKLNYLKIALPAGALINPEKGNAATIMLEKHEDPSNNIDDFISRVTSGQLYEYFVEIAEEIGLSYPKTRSEAKDMMFKVFFTDNRFIGQPKREAGMKQIFRTIYPEVYELFALIKKGKGEKNKLAILLQRIESYLIIEVICKKIARSNPEIPLYTIHDSIATTEDYVDEVERTMIETLKEYIGYAPTIKREIW